MNTISFFDSKEPPAHLATNSKLPSIDSHGEKHSCPMTFAQPVSISLNLKPKPNAWFVSGFYEFLLGFSQHFIIVFFF